MLDEHDLGTPCDKLVIPVCQILERLISELDLGPPAIDLLEERNSVER
jgi:hypothetical protein